MSRNASIAVKAFTVALIIVLQLVLTDFVNLGPYVSITLLPALILCLPTSMGTIPLMLISFGVGLGIDIFAEGVCGLNALALVWVGLLRNRLIPALIDKELISRALPLSRTKYPEEKILLVLLLLCLVFWTVFNIADLAGFRSVWFILLKTLLSSVLSAVIGYLVCITMLER